MHEEEMGYLPEKEFRVMIVKMISEIEWSYRLRNARNV